MVVEHVLVPRLASKSPRLPTVPAPPAGAQNRLSEYCLRAARDQRRGALRGHVREPPDVKHGHATAGTGRAGAQAIPVPHVASEGAGRYLLVLALVADRDLADGRRRHPAVVALARDGGRRGGAVLEGKGRGRPLHGSATRPHRRRRGHHQQGNDRCPSMLIRHTPPPPTGPRGIGPQLVGM